MSDLLARAATLALAPMAAMALYNLLCAPRLERAPPPRARPHVSLLVPARDEADNLRALLPALSALRYAPLEILVLDDHSSDGTGDVVRRHGGPARLLSGAPLPPGWLGKNWACHQLSEAATGQILLFCDADVRPDPRAVEQTVATLRAHGAGALTALPRQRFDGWAEAALVPLVAQLPVLALLPLPLVPRTASPSLSMANGQWLAFTRGAYRRCGGHAGVRGEVLEDVALGRRVKQAGQRLVVAVAARSLEVRMYAGRGEAVAGFAKNVYALLGGRTLPFTVGVAGFTLVAVYPWAAALLGSRSALLPLALLAAVRAAGAATFRHPVRSVALHPAGTMLALYAAARSWRGQRRGGLSWKGRPVTAAGAALEIHHGG